MRKLTVTIADFDKAVKVINAAIKAKRDYSIVTTCAVSQAARRTWKIKVSSCRTSVSSYRNVPGELLDKVQRFKPIAADAARFGQFVDAFDYAPFRSKAKAMLPLTVTLEPL